MPRPSKPPAALAAEILAHYAAVRERDRLTEGAGPLEFARTREIIERFLAPPPGVVLDVGGGAGAYACWLARRGYDTHLVDPIPAHVEQAERASRDQPDAPLATVHVGDARRLDVDDATAGAVLLLGPLYHLTDRAERLRALREARRVLAVGGRLFAAGISRFASTLDGMARELLADERFARIVARDLRDGQHRNPTDDPGYFTTAYFHRPEELRAEVREAGFRTEALLAVEGPAWLLQDLGRRWQDERRRERLLAALRLVESEPSMLGVSAHLLCVGTAVTPAPRDRPAAVRDPAS